MKEIAMASINTFGPSPKADVSPSEDPIFVLTSSQLQEFISRAIQPLQDRIESLEGLMGSQDEKMAALRTKLASLESLQESEISRVCVDIAHDRRRLAALEHPTKEPGKTETSRDEKIERYLASRPDHKVTYETLKGHLGIDKDLLNDAIKTLMAASPGRYGIIRIPGDKRKRALIMLPK